MKRVKKEFKGKVLSNGKIKHEFNTNDIQEDEIAFYEKMGFGFIFEEVKPKKTRKRKSSKAKKNEDDSNKEEFNK